MGKNTTSHRQPRQNRRIKEDELDPYMIRHKPPGSAVCPDCSAVYHKGRWQWPAGPQTATHSDFICPACRRVREGYPAGWLRLSGRFLDQHKEEILHLVRHTEALEKNEHPMNRIMAIDREDHDILITTTDIHLPRRMATAIQHAYAGTLEFDREEDSHRMRVSWTRED